MKNRARFVLRLCATLAMGVAALPAAAQVAPFDAGRLAKSEALLGGAPSSLAAIIAAQSASTPAAVSDFAAVPTNVAFPRRPSLFLAPATPATTASPDRPDVFNSIALPIARSSLDRRWKRVAAATVGGRPGHFAAGLRSLDEQARIEAVNSYVNARVAFTDDSRQFGVEDRWSPASETLSRGRGDCEDYALAKMAMLRRAGFADKDLYLVILKDLGRRADHAVLVIRSGGRFLVLDNGTDRLVDSADIRDYRPILTFSAGQQFVHGYRRSDPAAQMVLASAEPTWAPATAIAFSGLLPASSFARR